MPSCPSQIKSIANMQSHLLVPRFPSNSLSGLNDHPHTLYPHLHPSPQLILSISTPSWMFMRHFYRASATQYADARY